MARQFRIFPALGVARIGDARSEAFFIGPETPGVPANFDPSLQAQASFKEDGRIRRQAARFRIWEYEQAADGQWRPKPNEALVGRDAIALISWSVHLANRKASFGRRNSATTMPEADRRRRLDLDPGSRDISGRAAGPVIFENDHAPTKASISSLGELRTDADGRLLVLGGEGKTAQVDGATLHDRLDNDAWYDDIADGPVTARVTVINEDGSHESIEALGAWVVTAPPDFAPPVPPLISLYDVLWDQSVRGSGALPAYANDSLVLDALRRQRADWDHSQSRFTGYRPSFAREIAPLLERAFLVTFVHHPPGNHFHATLTPKAWADLGRPGNDKVRQSIFGYLRDPESPRADARSMPRAFGEQYVEDRFLTADDPRGQHPQRFLSLTQVQHALLRQWAEGTFEPDGAGPMPRPRAHAITPEGLDRAALENCIGAPMFPGFEVGSSVRWAEMYCETFRIEVGSSLAEPGCLTRQLALPWQADFRDCRRESVIDPMSGERVYGMWWSSQRPDDVLVSREAPHVPWLRPPHFTIGDDDLDPERGRFIEMVRAWSTLGFVADEAAGRFVERERNK